MPEHEEHYVHRLGWLRAAVLGANDGIVSNASLIAGVAAATPDSVAVLIAGVSGVVAGAMSMAAGESVSVSSQSDAETADLARERRALREYPELEREELAEIYRQRGLDAELAAQVAAQLMAKDDLASHARDELGITETGSARPVLAALTSSAAFTAGGLLPLSAALLAPPPHTIPAVAATALLSLGALGALSARWGGARVWRATARVLFWGALAMAVTAAIGRLVGQAV